MKVELNLEEDQLSLLDADLKSFLANMNDDQKLTILSTYINTQLEGFRIQKESSGWGYSAEYEYTDFGKQLIDGLSEKITEAVALNLLEQPQVKKLIDEKVSKAYNELDSIISSAISQYIISNLFSNQDSIQHMITSKVYDVLRQIRN